MIEWWSWYKYQKSGQDFSMGKWRILLKTDFSSSVAGWSLICEWRHEKIMNEYSERILCQWSQWTKWWKSGLHDAVKQKKIFWSTLKKSNFCPKIQLWQNPNIFTSFSPNFFLTIFLVKSKLSRAKKSKTTIFSRVFHPKNRQFSREIKVEFFGQKMKV